MYKIVILKRIIPIFLIVNIILIAYDGQNQIVQGSDNFFTTFSEDWETGEISSTKWLQFGTSPSFLHNQGNGSSSYSFDTNGTDSVSGIVTQEKFPLSNTRISAYAKYQNLGGENDYFIIGIADADPETISSSNHPILVGFNLSYDTNTDNQFIQCIVNKQVAYTIDTLVDNSWHKYTIHILDASNIDFYVDDTPYSPIGSISIQLDRPMIVFGRSADQDQYIDDLQIELSGDPVASFSYEPTLPTTKDEIDFTDESDDPDGNIVNWTWGFDDGNASYEPDPSHQYANPGTYEVSLIVTDNDDNTDSFSEQIVVASGNIIPHANFTFDLKSNLDLDTIQFTDESTDIDGTINGWDWDFGDGTTSSEEDPEHTFQNEDTYEVTLTVTDNEGAEDSITKEVRIDFTSPTIITITPSDGQNGVTVDTPIQIEFSEPMDKPSVESAFFPSPSIYSLDWQWNDLYTVVIIDHYDFSFGQEYSCQISSSAKDSSLMENHLEEVFTWTFSTPSEPGIISGTITDAKFNKLNAEIYANNELIGKAYQGEYSFYLEPGTYIISFNLEGYPTIIKPNIVITGGETTTVDCIMTQVDFSVHQNEVGFDFDFSDFRIPISGEFKIPIRITPIQKFNPGEEYQVSVGYTPKEMHISGELPDMVLDIFDFVGGTVSTWIIDWATKGFGELDDTNIKLTVVDNPIGYDSILIYEKYLEFDYIWGAVVFDLDAWLDIKGDILGNAVSEGPVSIQNPSVYFTNNKFKINIDEDAQPGEEVKIGIIPSYEIACKLLAEVYLDVPLKDPYTTGEVPIYPRNGWSTPINVPSIATIGFVGLINHPPHADFHYADNCYTTLSKIQFSDSSSDPDGTISSWLWNFGDGDTATGQNPKYRYIEPGTYTVNLTVTDDTNAKNSTTQTIIILDAPLKITSPEINSQVGGKVTIEGTAVSSGCLDTIQSVEVSLDSINGSWKELNGTENWKYTFDSKSLSNGFHIFHFRCSDGVNHSGILTFHLDIFNKGNVAGTVVEPGGNSIFPQVPGFEITIIFLAIIVLFLLNYKKFK